MVYTPIYTVIKCIYVRVLYILYVYMLCMWYDISGFVAI